MYLMADVKKFARKSRTLSDANYTKYGKAAMKYVGRVKKVDNVYARL